MLGRIEAELLSRLSRRTARDHARSDLVHAAAVRAPSERVGDTARRVGVSERHLRDLFSGAVGVSPKRLASITRVRAVLTRVRDGALARIATEAGYYDQSHMGAEFRATMGVSPGAFVTGDLPAPTPC